MLKAEQMSEYCIDLTEDSDEDRQTKELNTEESISIDSEEEKDEKHVIKKVKKSPQKAKARKSRVHILDDQSPEYFDHLLEKAVSDIRKGGSLAAISVQYGIPEEVIYEKLVSRTLPNLSDILTKNEEKNLVKWILSSNRNNSIIFKHQLLDRVGKYKKVAKITPIFSKSKFGRMWFQHFMNSHPEIYDNDGLLMPTGGVVSSDESENDEWGPSTSRWPDKDDIRLSEAAFGTRSPRIKKEPTEPLVSLGIKTAVVVLHDFRKQKDPPFILDEKGKVTINTFIKKESSVSGIESELTDDKKHVGQSNVIIEVDESKIQHAMLNENHAEMNSYSGKLIEVCHVKLTESDSDVEVDDNAEEEVRHPQLNEGESDIENNKDESETYHVQLHESDSDIELNKVAMKTTENSTSDVKYKTNSDESTIGRDISNLPDCTKKKRKYCKKKTFVNLGTPTCEICGRTFFNNCKLKRHMYIHMPMDQYSFSCKKCSKKFPSNYHLKIHLSYTHSRRSFKCHDCDNKVFKHRTSLRNHQRHHHFNLVDSSRNTGDKNVDSKSNLVVCKSISGDFVCDICGNHFTYKNSLKSHIRFVHLKEEKPFPCNFCKLRFIKHSDMQRHKRTHSKIKKLSCSYCSKSYSRSYLLRGHILVCDRRKEEDKEIECTKTSNEYLNSMEVK